MLELWICTTLLQKLAFVTVEGGIALLGYLAIKNNNKRSDKELILRALEIAIAENKIKP